MFDWGERLRVLTLVGVTALSAACSKSTDPPPSPLGTKGSAPAALEQTCGERLRDDPVSFPLPIAPALPTSVLAARIQIEKTALEQRIAAEIPVELARANRRSVGAAGKATYRVWRGQPKLALRGDTLSTTVPIMADIEICKPVGPVCVRYGACQPTFEAVVEAELTLDEDGELPKTRTSVRAGRHCNIVGFDVTHRLLSEARRELANVKARIDRSLPRIRPLRERLRDESPFVGQLEPDGCLILDPTSVGLSQVVQRGELFVAHVVASGVAVIQPECPADKPRVTENLLPITRLEKPYPRTDVQAPYELGWTEAEAALNAALANAPARNGVRLERVALSPAHTEAGDVVVLRAELSGASCGSANFSALPTADPRRRGVLGWSKLTPLGSASAATARAVEQILNGLEAPRAPFDTEYLRDEGLHYFEQARSALPAGAGFEHELELEETFVITPAALRWLARVHGDTRLSYSSPPPTRTAER